MPSPIDVVFDALEAIVKLRKENKKLRRQNCRFWHALVNIASVSDSFPAWWFEGKTVFDGQKMTFDQMLDSVLKKKK